MENNRPTQRIGMHLPNKPKKMTGNKLTSTLLSKSIAYISNKIREGYTALVGNRVSALGVALATGAVGAVSLENDHYLVPMLAGGIGGTLLGISQCGTKTLEFYKRTLKSIDKHGKLDERFLRTILESENVSTFIGYCQTQGAYLAARDSGQLNLFYKVRDGLENKIPNF